MERNIQKNGLINLVVMLGMGAAAFGVARYSNSLSGQVASVFLGLGALVAFVSWFQMRLEDREHLERLELDELARSRGSATLFEGKESEVFPAQRSRQQFEKFFVPGFTVVLLGLEIAAAVVLWRWLSRPDTFAPFRQELVAMSLLALLALILFLVGRFSATLARLENHRLLRPSASYLLLGAYLSALAALAIAGVKAEFPKTDLLIARGLTILLWLAAAETLVALVLEIYRPRLKGKVGRPLYDSRLVGLLAQPEGLVNTAAQTLDYQFGFKLSETRLFSNFKVYAQGMVLGLIALLLLSTCVVFIETGEHGVLERFGKPVPQALLAPGPHLKMPWPIDQVYRFRTEQIQTLNVGAPEEDDHDEKVVVWAIKHGDEENFLVADREPASEAPAASPDAKRAPPVNLLTVSIPVQFQVQDLMQWAYNHEDSSNLLHQIATREVVRYLVSVDVGELMSRDRLEASLTLRDRIQKAADLNQLGAKVLFVGLQDVHPPQKVAAEYEKVVGAAHQQQAKIIAAEADAIRTNALATAAAYKLTNSAEAARISIELTALARVAAFTNQMAAYQAAPSVYKERAYFHAFAATTAKVQKYVILATNTANVFQFNLERRAEDAYTENILQNVTKPKQ